MNNISFLHKNALYFSLFSALVFISISTGFDFYAHSVSYYFYDQQINYNDILFFNIAQPRYLLLSIIYEFFSRMGVPLGYVALFLLIYPIYNIVKNLKIYKYKSYNFYQILVLFFLIYSSFYYSGLSLVILWLLAAALSKKNIFLFGGLFHPVGVVLFIITFLFISRKKLFIYLFILVFFYFFLYISNMFGLLTSFGYENIRFNSNYVDFSSLLIQVINKKHNEILQLLFASMLLYFGIGISKRRNIFAMITKYSLSFGRRFYIRVIFIRIAMIFIIIILHIYMFQKQTLINNIYTFNISNPIYISWFDFGEKDLKKVTYPILYYQRYKNGIGY